MLKIVVAPDSFKGSLSSMEVAESMSKGVLSVFPGAEVIQLPIADGGEGTVESLVWAKKGVILTSEVIGPMGEKVKAEWGMMGDGETGVIEVAAASGLPLVPREERNPLVATSYGTGQLIMEAIERGVNKLIVGLGGSATNDGGAGMAQALGVTFFDKGGRVIPEGKVQLNEIRGIDASTIDSRLGEIEILVASDVTNPLCGPNGASYVYGPQKGADQEMIPILDTMLHRYGELAKQATGRKVADFPGAGAAGGLGSALLFFTEAKFRKGIELVMETIEFESHLKDADLVLTGEGNTDYQSAFGKAPAGIAEAAKKFDIPVLCISGGLGEGSERIVKEGIDGLMSIVPSPMTLESCMEKAAELLENATSRTMTLLKIGMHFKIREKID
ncbi:glycerate kinase [Mesobacillus foraminis]|uniref:glycerate kinase n=1 Tax=Mesobacillus foraminis TaxID=279826 RepID=UPI00214CA696|nr:glycerate kinase [Mesobacillus foraminis]